MVFKTVEWSDSITNAKGWIVLDLLVNNVAGGGIFITENASLKEVKDLAHTMSYKHLLYQPMCGGAKAGIKFDPFDKRADEVLKRFLIDNQDLLRSNWVTGADLNTNNNVIHQTLESLNLGSGFFALGKYIADQVGIANQAYNFHPKIITKVDNLFNLSEVATGYGVYCTIKILRDELKIAIPKIIIQGFGAVGSSLAYFINKYNLGKIVGIVERDCYVYNEEGIDINVLTKNTEKELSREESHLLKCARRNMKNNCMIKEPLATKNQFLIDFLSQCSADYFIPCATRYQITTEVLMTLRTKTFLNSKTPCIVEGANNPFFNTEIIEHSKQSINIIPSWISNCGNMVLFVESLKVDYIPKNWVNIIFSKIEEHITKFLTQALIINKFNLYDSCYKAANTNINNSGIKF